MKYFTYIGITLVVLWVAREPAVLFWFGFFAVVSLLFFYAFPEEAPSIKREKRKLTIEL